MKIFENGIGSLMTLIQEEASWMFDDVEEIGTSDVSCFINKILSYFYDHFGDASEIERNAIRNILYDTVRNT